MKRAILPVILLALAVASGARSDEEEGLVVRVNRAIDRGAARLVKEQKDDGSWRKDDKVHPLGRTALCTFALLHAGYPDTNPAVRKALSFLGVGRGYANWKKPISTYEASCLVLMLNALGKEHGKQIREICQWLCDVFCWKEGMWGYPGGGRDLSNTQFAVMALKAGERHGFKAPKKIWKRLIDTVLRLQADGGGIRYHGGKVYTATMTHAGCLTLLFAYRGLGMKSPPGHVKAALVKAHRWYAERYDVERNPHGRGWAKGNYYYYMYGLERYAIFFGFDEIAGHDWYAEGAEELIERQGDNGAWGRLEETCFAILFLRKATFSEPEIRVFGLDEEDGKKKERPGRPRPEEGVPYLKDWLIAGPFLGEKHEDDQLYTQHVPVSRTKPVEGGPAGKMAWIRHTSSEDKIDLRLATRGQDWACWYAAVYLHAEKGGPGVLWCDSDDGLRVWLNGAEVLFGHHHGHCGDDFYRVPIELVKGRNLLVLQVENLDGDVYFKARLSDEKGWPLTGVRDSTSFRPPKGQ